MLAIAYLLDKVLNIIEIGEIIPERLNMEESYMTIKEFCEKLQVSSSTVYRMIKNGMIPAIKFGRYWKIPRSVFHKCDKYSNSYHRI